MCNCLGHKRNLHSFPTRRSSDLFGPMKKHENRAIETGEVSNPENKEQIDIETKLPMSNENKISDLILPIGILRSEEHTSELQSRGHLVCRLLLEKKKDIVLITRN